MQVMEKVSMRGYKTLRTIFLFTFGAIVVFLSFLFPRIFGSNEMLGMTGGGIAQADAPGSCGNNCVANDGCGCGSCSSCACGDGGCDSSADGY